MKVVVHFAGSFAKFATVDQHLIHLGAKGKKSFVIHRAWVKNTGISKTIFSKGLE